MANQIQTVANVSTGTTIVSGTTATAAGLTGWIESNSVVIGIFITVCSFLVMLLFQFLNYRINKGREERESRDKKAAQIADLKMKGFTDDQIKQTFKLAEGK